MSGISGAVRAIRNREGQHAWRWISLGFLTIAIAALSLAASGDTTADRVLGQVDFAHNSANLTDARGLWQPAAVAIDTSATPNRVYLADTQNSRVLGWNNAAGFANDAPAD